MTQSKSNKLQTARERLLNAAAVLFYNDGITATGIDAIVKKAGVAKKSLYNNFESKAELVATYLEARHAEWLELYQNRLYLTKTPIDKILAIFLAYQDHAEHAYERGFRGCGLLNAAAELPADASGRMVVKAHKEEVEGLLARHLADYLDGDKDRAAQIAKHLSYLLEGAMARAGLEGNSHCVRQAIIIANTMLETL